MRYVRAEHLEKGMVLVNTLYDNNEKILLKANRKLTQNYINRIQQMDIIGVYVFEDDDVEEHKTIVSEQTRLRAIQSLKRLNIDDCILNLANKLEYFSICFNSGIADEDTVYQSLHSAFFDCVHMLYVFIFYANTSEHDRFFSNISSLYVRWRDWYDTLIEQENDEINKMKKRVNDKIVVKSKK